MPEYKSKTVLVKRQNRQEKQQEIILNDNDYKKIDENRKTVKSEQLIQKIIEFKDFKGNKLIQKYTLPYLITLLDKNKIQSIDKVYKIKQQGFNLLQFIRFFLNAIQHHQIETLYLTMGLVDFFKTISETNNFAERIKFIHLTDFVCSNILQAANEKGANDTTASIGGSNNYAQNKIQMKLIPSHKPISPNYQIKQYITNPPTIYGNKQQAVYKISLSNTKVDKNKHDSVVMASFFSFQYKKIFSLDALSDGISIYDTNCRLQKKLRPQNSKIKKDVVVLGFAYSQRQQRIGAVLKDFTLSFWDFADNLQFQKVISTASCCQQFQTNIWYLQYFQAWITSDKTGIIYIWNLQKQLPQRKLQCKYKGKINDVCQIPCLNIIAIAQQCRINRLNPGKKECDQAKIILYNYFRGEQVGQISTMTDMRIPHTLQYSESYQVLLSAGFQKKINIFQINHKYLDTNLKGELMGHQNLITNFMLVKKTPMVVSSDDKGKVKIWDIRNYKCIQTLDFRDKTIITRLLDMVEIGKVGVLGSRINFLQYDERLQIVKKYQSKQKNLPLGVNYMYEYNKMLVITRKDIRLYSMQTGAIQKVFCDYHNKDEQIVVFKYYELMKKVVIGNEKGQIKIFSFGGVGQAITSNNQNLNSEGKSFKQQKLQGFQNGLVTHIEYDQQNKLFLTCGENGTINIQKLLPNSNIPQINYNQDQQYQQQNQKNKFYTKKSNHKQLIAKQTCKRQVKSLKSEQWTIIRQMKGNFNNKDITVLALSVYHGMIAIGSTCSQIYIWDYEYAKLLFCIELPNKIQPTAMTFLNGFSILMIAAGNGEIYFVRLLRSNQHQYQQKKSYNNNQTIVKTIQPQLILSFMDNRIVKKTQKTFQILQQLDENDYITQLLVDTSLKGTHSKSQSLQFCKIYIAYCSGKVTILNLSQFLKKIPILPHRKTLPTYNPQRQLKQQFSIQLQKDKCLTLQIKPITPQTNNKFKSSYSYQFFKPHHGSINAMKILEFDKHYLLTCGNDQRVKLWEQNPSKANFHETASSKKSIVVNIKQLSDFNVNLPLPYLWNFQVKEYKKTKDKIMFSLKIIQSIFKKFGSDISTGQSKILKLETFFKSIQKQPYENEGSNFNYLTEPLNTTTQNQTKKTYLFHEQFTKKDMHYDEIKKFNFYEIAGPSLRELQFKKKIQDMQKQWQVSKVKQQQDKNQLLYKIQHRAQKNQEKQQIINFLQDRQYLKKRMRKQDQDLFPLVKKINQQFKKIQTTSNMSQSIMNKQILLSNVKQNSHLNEFKNLLGSTTGNMKLNKITSHYNQTLSSQQDKPQYGCLLRRNNFSTVASKLVKNNHPKGFEDYYKKKMGLDQSQTKQNINSKQENSFNHYQRQDTIKTKHSEFMSLNNSRIVSHSSIHNQGSKKDLSFQKILKNMNNRVLLSRQARHVTTASTQNIGFMKRNQNKKFQNQTQRKDSKVNMSDAKVNMSKTQYQNAFKNIKNRLIQNQ